MKRSYLLVDVPNTVFRSFYAFQHRNSSFGDNGAEADVTSAAFGLVRELRGLAERFPAAVPVFCFDVGTSKRRTLCPTYKAKRRTKAENDLSLVPIRKLLDRLREEVLPQLTPNVFGADGFEADDIIASTVYHYPTTDFVLASSDKDLWQLLDGQRVVIWNSHKKVVFTERMFDDEWRLPSRSWCDVKALAGCSSDEIKGVEGVGETLAARYWRGELSNQTSTWVKATKFIDGGGFKNNLKLVKLPFAGCPAFELRNRMLRERDWDRLADLLGVKKVEAKR